MSLRWKFVLMAALAWLPVAVSAQTYPDHPVRFVVGFPPGSSIDVVSRIVLDDISARTGAVFVIENRAGALGAISVQAVEKAAADGYTLMPSSSATHSSGPHLLRALADLDPVAHLSHVGRMVHFDIAVVTSATGPYADLKSLLDAAKAKPEALAYGYGSGTGQVGAAAFSRAAGADTRAISYKGQPAAVNDLIAQRIDFVASDLGAVMGFVQQGALRGIALLADKRSTILPEIPTAAELGIGNAVLGGWIGVDGPPALPAPIMTWWADQLQKSLSSAAVQDKVRKIGMETTPLFGDEFNTFVATENNRWGEKVREAGIQAE